MQSTWYLTGVQYMVVPLSSACQPTSFVIFLNKRKEGLFQYCQLLSVWWKCLPMNMALPPNVNTIESIHISCGFKIYLYQPVLLCSSFPILSLHITKIFAGKFGYVLTEQNSILISLTVVRRLWGQYCHHLLYLCLKLVCRYVNIGGFVDVTFHLDCLKRNPQTLKLLLLLQ